MTDLESPRKNNDCYFYYYSTCAKGDSCTFRHEPSALGCETMCSFWKEGKCLNVHCNFRHMELRKNRKAIPCYWESQPGGCLKPHCPFLHQAPKPPSANESNDSKTDSGTESANNSMTDKIGHLSDKNFKNAPVDSLVVNFEEESDNESAPTCSPIKPNHRVVKVKTWEEIKLEKIQAESAAYYSYTDVENQSDATDLRQRILERFSKTEKNSEPGKKRSLEVEKTEAPPSKKQKKETDIKEIKIKTLAEIRAERAKKTTESQENSTSAICDSSVSSSTEEKEENVQKTRPRIKLQREPLYIQETKEDNMLSDDKVKDTIKSDESVKDTVISDEDVKMCEENNVEVNRSNKTVDEVLLLQDDDDASNVSLKDEERLLNELEDFLED